MTIASTLLTQSSSYFNEEGFLVFLDDNVRVMINSNSIISTPIPATQALKYRNDVIGLMNSLGIPYPAHAAVLHINRIKYNSLGSPPPENILVPEVPAIRSLYNAWKSSIKSRK